MGNFVELEYSIFISVFKQLDAQNLFHSEFYFMPLQVPSSWLNTEINILRCTVNKTSKFEYSCFFMLQENGLSHIELGCEFSKGVLT